MSLISPNDVVAASLSAAGACLALSIPANFLRRFPLWAFKTYGRGAILLPLLSAMVAMLLVRIALAGQINSDGGLALVAAAAFLVLLFVSALLARRLPQVLNKRAPPHASHPVFHRGATRITYDAAFRVSPTLGRHALHSVPMALKSTIFKAELSVSDMDRPYYGSHALTIAQHPSENDARMMVRLLAFACEASETLAFTRGLDEPDEPDLWDKTLTGDIEHWIELGQPDESRLKRAAARADRVTVYTYQSASAREWWKGMAGKASKLRNVTVYNVPSEAVDALAQMAQRAMRLSVTIQDGDIWVSDDDHNVQLTRDVLQRAD